MIAGLLIATALTTPASDIAAGKSLFERQWVAASSAMADDEGLGPLYDASSCNACHAGGGPGRVSGSIGTGLVVRLGRADGTSDPIYGAQLQTKALPGVTPEAAVTIRWEVLDGRRIGSPRLADLGYGALDASTRIAFRRAPSLFGVGALASISDADVLAMEIREQRQGLSGHAAVTIDKTGWHIGRWGWKAQAIDLDAQVASAMQRDMGLSTRAHPEPWGECTQTEIACRDAATRSESEGKIEVPDNLRHQIVAYISSLQTPRSPDEKSRGYAVFSHAGCESCHASYRTKDHGTVKAFTDLLLHDMGPELDDGIAEGGAKSSEWRTAPLWNLASELAAGGLLHDGRARDIAEAVRWHGGEAAPSRSRFRALDAVKKAELEEFLLGD